MDFTDSMEAMDGATERSVARTLDTSSGFRREGGLARVRPPGSGFVENSLKSVIPSVILYGLSAGRALPSGSW